MTDFELGIALRLSRPSAIFHFFSNDEMLAETGGERQCWRRRVFLILERTHLNKERRFSTADCQEGRARLVP